MIRVSKRVRASVVALSLGLLLTSTTFVTTANASTIKTGVACKKEGQKGKAGSKRYVCGNNPYVTPTKLTWMLSQCAQEIENFNMLKDGERQALDLAKLSGLNFKSLSEIANSLEGQDKKDVEDMINSINKTDKALKNTLCKRGV
jgi:hypothetical protein